MWHGSKTKIYRYIGTHIYKTLIIELPPQSGLLAMMQSVIKLVRGLEPLEQEQVRTEEQLSLPPVLSRKNKNFQSQMFYRNSLTNHMQSDSAGVCM